MAISLSTTTLPAIDENVEIAEIITISRTLIPPDPEITSVVVTKGANTEGNVVITVGEPDLISGNVSLTFSGRYNDNFTNSITYEDGNQQVQTVGKFADITAGFNFVSEYLADGTGSVTASYSVVVNGSELGPVTQLINNNYTPGKDNLVAYVAQGKY